MPRYAEKTRVPVAQSEAELKKTLVRYGADNIMIGSSQEQAMALVAFTMKGRSVKITLPLPPLEDFAVRKVGGRWGTREVEATDSEQQKAWSQACRQRWRALLIMTKSKLEYVDLMPDAFDMVFLSDFVLPKSRGRTIGEEMTAQLDQLDAVPLLPMGRKGK